MNNLQLFKQTLTENLIEKVKEVYNELYLGKTIVAEYKELFYEVAVNPIKFVTAGEKTFNISMIEKGESVSYKGFAEVSIENKGNKLYTVKTELVF